MEKLIKFPSPSVRQNIVCQVCGRQEAKTLYQYTYHNQNSEILQCLNCQHLFLYPVPLVKLEERSMQTVSDAEFFGNNTLKTLHERFVILREIRAAKNILKTENPALLDIGCGTGWTTAVWQKEGFSVTGLEPSDSRSRVAREKYGLNVINTHLENFSTEEKFDILILRHLLEHIENPAAMLKKIKAFLKPGGLLLIVLPNINCIGRYLFRENWTWVLPWHLHFYTPRTIRLLAENNGFKKIKLYQTPSPLWYPGSLQKVLKLKKTPPNVLSLILFSPLMLLGLILNLNDNLTLIAQNVTTE